MDTKVSGLDKYRRGRNGGSVRLWFHRVAGFATRHPGFVFILKRYTIVSTPANRVKVLEEKSSSTRMCLKENDRGLPIGFYFRNRYARPLAP